MNWQTVETLREIWRAKTDAEKIVSGILMNLSTRHRAGENRPNQELMLELRRVLEKDPELYFNRGGGL